MTLPRPGNGNRRVNPPEAEEKPQVEWSAAPTEGGGDKPPARRRWRWWVTGTLVALLAVVLGAWFAFPIRTVNVSGNQRLSEARVLELAGLTPQFGWWYYGTWRARGLLGSPWVQSAVVTRQFPDTVNVVVTERVPVARWQRPDGSVVALSTDGLLMPGAQGLEALPLITGWGPERAADALQVLRVLGGYNVQSVSYTPSGLTAELPAGSVWSGDLQSLVKYAGSISMYPKKNIHIYPWGVSVQE